MEVLQDGGAELVEAFHLDTVQHPMRGQDREPLVLRVHEEHHDGLPGRIGTGVRETLPHPVPDGEHGLVAMMTVGDVDLQARHGAADHLAFLRVGEPPHPVPHADGLLHEVDDGGSFSCSSRMLSMTYARSW